jgi:two-component system, NtrC family, response regulator PilR
MTAPTPPRLLVVDDEPDLRTLYELSLLREGYDVDSAGTVAEAWAALESGRYQALITDMRLPDGTGLELLQRLERAGRGERAIVITAYGSAENAVQSLKAGAFDYLTKPVDLRRFRAVVAAAVGRVGRGADAAAPPPLIEPPAEALQRMAGSSPPMQQVRRLIDKVARSMAPVLVQGESGTGKELVARAIHELSTRAAQPFVAVNCGAIPEALLEAEFFGHRKGAFTGATEHREGFFQAAQGGTLFLDEIGDLPLAMQSKLLRAVQERAVRPVGAVTEQLVDVRILSATHKDLAQEVQAGRFRHDLYYRLNVIPIRVPPLRERREDLAELCERLLQRIAAESGGGVAATLSGAALECLAAHDFPGNVRELENLLHRAVALAASPHLQADDLDLTMAACPVVAPPPSPDAGPVPGHPAAGLPELEPAGTAVAALAPVAAPAVPADLARYLDSVEREVLMRALERHHFNRTAAGASMGLTLRQMRYRMARLGILLDGDSRAPEGDDGSPPPAE